jgi:hypothetical protein
MKKLILTLLFLSLSGNLLAASNLDLTYPHPSPTKALMWSMIVPGGGGFYLSSTKPRYGSIGALFFVAEIGLLISGNKFAQKNSKDSITVVLPWLLVGGIKIFEFDYFVESAEKERNKVSKMPGYQ